MPKDIPLSLPSYPGTASRHALHKAVNMARLLEAHITCLVVETTGSRPATATTPICEPPACADWKALTSFCAACCARPSAAPKSGVS